MGKARHFKFGVQIDTEDEPISVCVIDYNRTGVCSWSHDLFTFCKMSRKRYKIEIRYDTIR